MPPDGEPFQAVTRGRTVGQKSKVQTTWNSMRTIRLLSAHGRTVAVIKQAGALRQPQSKGFSLK
jgi:hypothetical protein